jgi:hypothetical protein
VEPRAAGCYTLGMKKHNTPAKLTLKPETVKLLKSRDLENVVGGVTNPCAHPTTTVLPTGPC